MTSVQTGGEKPRIGVLGLGRMGRAMAARLAGEGFVVAGWTRSGITEDTARNLRLTACPDIRAAAAATDVILLSLSDDAAVTSVIEELARCDLAGKLVVDTSTVSPDTLRRLAGAIGKAGGAPLDAPISGGPDMVLAGTAGLYVGGEAGHFERFRPVAQAISNRIHHVGGLGEGAAAKIVNNMMLLGYWQCLKEAVQVGKRAGLKAEKMLEILSASPAASGAFVHRIPVILGHSDQIGFTVTGVVKDGVLISRTAQQYGVPVPAMELALTSFQACKDAGHGDADLAIMVRAAYSDA
jgi:3-hydroxyisobutyrate dehydrogenase